MRKRIFAGLMSFGMCGVAMASPMSACFGTIAIKGMAFHQDVSVIGNVRLSPTFPSVIETIIGPDTVSLYVRESEKNPGKLLIHMAVIKKIGMGKKAEVAHPHGEISMRMEGYQPLSDGFKAKVDGCASKQK